MLKEFIYDGTFEGLLTAIYYAYGYKEKCTIIKNEDYIPSMVSDIVEVTTEEDKFKRVYNSIIEKLNDDILRKIYYLYLSEIHKCEDIALNYLKLCYKYGTKVNLAKNNDIIIAVDKYCKRVSFEAHRFTGFVRFKEIGYLSFYAKIEPDHNILPLIMKHFKRRFSDQNFIIHDIKRELAIIYNKNEAIITELSREKGDMLNSIAYNSDFESLWETFYKSVNIEERKNHRCRNQHMPKRYWKNLIEISNKDI